MNNLISVCGNSGSGKSLVSCAIANEITRKYKKSVIIISPNKVAPMLPVFLPLQTFQRQNSIGDLFLNGVNFQNLKGKIHLHPKNSNLAFMGYIETDNIFRYNSDISKNEMFSLLSLLSNSSDNSLCDYVIIDCDHNIPSCNISSFAVDNSFANLIVASPDNKGISYLTSQEPFIYGSKNDNQKSITILNNCYNYSPAAILKKENLIDIHLPHCKTIYEEFLTGGKFSFHNEKEFKNGIGRIVSEIMDGDDNDL